MKPATFAGSHRVHRGGSWDDDARYVRAAFRGWDDPDSRYNNISLRLVRTVKVSVQPPKVATQ